MKKHAAGFVFFLSIVSLSVVGYMLLQAFTIPHIGVADPGIEDEPTVCFPKLNPGKVKVTQAIANESDNTFSFSLNGGLDRKDNSAGKVILAFYRLQSDGARFVRSDMVDTPSGDRSVNGFDKRVIRYKHKWFDHSRDNGNLYVTACAVGSECEMNQVPPFSEKNTVPVLIAKK